MTYIYSVFLMPQKYIYSIKMASKNYIYSVRTAKFCQLSKLKKKYNDYAMLYLNSFL